MFGGAKMALTTPCIRLKCPCGRGDQGQAVWNSFAPSWARTERPLKLGKDPVANIAPAAVPAAVPIRRRRLSTISSNVRSVAIGVSFRSLFLCLPCAIARGNHFAVGIVILGGAWQPPFSRRGFLATPPPPPP